MDIKSTLNLRPKADTAAALRTSLADTEAALVVARATVAELETTRGAVLLDGSDAEADAHERKLAAAQAAAGRLSAMAAALPGRITEAEDREHNAELDALAARTEADSEAGAALLPRILRDLAAVAALMREHDALTTSVAEANRVLRAGGRERVPVPMRRLWPDPDGRQPVVFGFENAAFGPSVFAPPPPNGFGTGTVGRWLDGMAGKL